MKRHFSRSKSRQRRQMKTSLRSHRARSLSSETRTNLSLHCSLRQHLLPRKILNLQVLISCQQLGAVRYLANLQKLKLLSQPKKNLPSQLYLILCSRAMLAATHSWTRVTTPWFLGRQATIILEPVPRRSWATQSSDSHRYCLNLLTALPSWVKLRHPT